jgi:GxxExxY protein
MLHKSLTGQIIKSFYQVYNTLGYGFLEKVYENALAIELRDQGFQAEQQRKIEVFYKEAKVGYYFADIIVNNVVILEIKATEGIVEANEYQLINYLKATKIETGLLLNFGKSPQFVRRVFTNNIKQL